MLGTRNMHVEVIKGNILESRADAIILTVDGARAGMEGNVARAFQRKHPDAWEELELEFEYPIALGSAKIYPIHGDPGCNNRLCILTSTLHHIEVLETSEKLKVLSSALRTSLALASRRGANSVCSAVLSGGWRLQTTDALDEMVKTYNRYKTTASNAPVLYIYVLGAREFADIKAHLRSEYEVREVNGKLMV
jgi:O-acetyl-ADP-ribose deacetylase (regulator of RNase III)